jgi:hypothetical protein
MFSYFTVHACNGPNFGAAMLAENPSTIEGAREQFRHWRAAGASRIIVKRHDVWPGYDTEHVTICDWQKQ